MIKKPYVFSSYNTVNSSTRFFYFNIVFFYFKIPKIRKKYIIFKWRRRKLLDR